MKLWDMALWPSQHHSLLWLLMVNCVLVYSDYHCVYYGCVPQCLPEYLNVAVQVTYLYVETVVIIVWETIFTDVLLVLSEFNVKVMEWNTVSSCLPMVFPAGQPSHHQCHLLTKQHSRVYTNVMLAAPLFFCFNSSADTVSQSTLLPVHPLTLSASLHCCQFIR